MCYLPVTIEDVNLTVKRNFKEIMSQTLRKQGEQLMLWNESTIILAVVGMVGLFSTAIIWQRANRITT